VPEVDGNPVANAIEPGKRPRSSMAPTIVQAIEMPHLLNRFGTYDLEKGTAAEKLAPALEALGFKTEIRDLTSGLHGIEITPQGLEGGADTRREGVAIGE